MTRKEKVIIGIMILTTFFTLYMFSFFIRSNNNQTMFDESLISFFAFSLLILTSYMQYKMLNIQKDELNLQRKELEQTRAELKGQKKELENSNRINRLTKTDNMFFQLINYKDNIIQRYSIDFTREIEASIERYEFEILDKFFSNIDENERERIFKLRNENIAYFYEKHRNKLERILEKEKENLQEDITDHLKLVVAINNLIKVLVEDKEMPSVFAFDNNFIETFKGLLNGYRKPDLESKNVAEKLLLEEEKDLVKLLSDTLTYEDYIFLVKKYNYHSLNAKQLGIIPSRPTFYYGNK